MPNLRPPAGFEEGYSTGVPLLDALLGLDDPTSAVMSLVGPGMITALRRPGFNATSRAIRQLIDEDFLGNVTPSLFKMPRAIAKQIGRGAMKRRNTRGVTDMLARQRLKFPEFFRRIANERDAGRPLRPLTTFRETFSDLASEVGRPLPLSDAQTKFLLEAFLEEGLLNPRQMAGVLGPKSIHLMDDQILKQLFDIANMIGKR